MLASDLLYELAQKIPAECVRALSQHVSVIYGTIGALTALVIVQILPTVLALAHSDTSIEITRTRVVAFVALFCSFGAIGAVAALFADPSTIKDAIAWGAGSDGLFLGLTHAARTYQDSRAPDEPRSAAS